MTPTDSAARLDPYSILHALQEARVDFVLVGGLARVIQGSDEVTRGLDLVPSRREANVRRLEAALQALGADVADGTLVDFIAREPSGRFAIDSPAGAVTVLPEPIGTRGYEDLRRKASHAALGDGLRPRVAAPGDLVRMLEALDRPEQAGLARAMRRVVELDRGLGVER